MSEYCLYLSACERMATKQGAELVGNPNYGDDYDLYVEQAKRGDMPLP